MSRYSEKEQSIRHASQQLLLEGVYLFKNNRDSNFVNIKVYNLLMVMKYMDYERRDNSTSKGSYMEGSSDVIVQVEEVFFLPTIKLILNDKNPAKPVLMVKHCAKKFELHSVEDQGVISHLWEIIRRRCILYVSPSKIPGNKSIRVEAQRNEPFQMQRLGNLIMEILLGKNLGFYTPKLNYLYETPQVTGVMFKAVDDDISAKKALQTKQTTPKKLALAVMDLFHHLQEIGYSLRWIDLDSTISFSRHDCSKVILKDFASIDILAGSPLEEFSKSLRPFDEQLANLILNNSSKSYKEVSTLIEFN